MISYTSFFFFIIFFGSTFLLHIFLPARYKWLALLFGSYAFYFISARGQIFPFILSSFVVWVSGMVIQYLNDKMKLSLKGVPIEEKKKIKNKYRLLMRLVLGAGIIFVVSVLLICKYSTFLGGIFKSLIPEGVVIPDIVQPLGISFFTLEGISYIADVYLGKIKAEKNPFRISLYMSFMLTVVEGPIARYDQLGVQFAEGGDFDIEQISKGFMRVIWGLFKKVVIADRAAMLVNVVFDNYGAYSGIIIVAAVLFYTLQLYCEFSGVMDIVCGFGSMLGIRLPENFRQPFFAKTINEFWQRWHITLGTWLRDYVFYSISYSKGFRRLSAKAKQIFEPYYANLLPTLIALFFVWFTNGFWHGAGWKYILYGLYYYFLMTIGLLLEPLFAAVCKKLGIDRKSRGFCCFQMVRTFLLVNIGMLIFRANDIYQAASMLKSVFTGLDLAVLVPGHGNGLRLSLYDYAALAVCVAVLIAVEVMIERGVDIMSRIYKLPYPVKVMLYSAALLIIIIIGAYGKGYGVIDPIYANF